MDKPSEAPEKPRQATDQDFEEIRQSMAGSMSQDEADRKARIEYLRSLTAQKQPKKKRGWLKALIALVVVVTLAGGVFWFMDKKADDDQKDAKDNTTKQQSQQEEAASQTTTKHYDSTALGLGFDYPENWKVTEASGKITAVSPPVKLRTTSGTVNAQIVFMIQSKQTSLLGFSKGNGTATRTSEKMAYVKPTPNQRAQTYMTFVSNAGSATVGIDAIFVTGDLGYQKDQAVPQADIVQGDPLVSMFFARCQDDACAADPSTTKTTIADSAWSDSSATVKAAKAILTSLTIQ